MFQWNYLHSQVTMSSKRHHSQRIPFNAKKIKKIDHCFSQAAETQQNDSNLPQTSMKYAKCPKDVTDLQAQGPPEQPVPPTKTMNVSLKRDHRAHVLKYSEGGSLYEALTSLQAVREKIETQKGKEILVRGTEGIEGYINLGMPLSCFPENCHLEITFARSGSEQKIESQEFAGCSKESSKCVKFYIHVVGKELRRILKSRHLQSEGCKLCIYAFKEETIRQALRRDDRLHPLLESGDWKLIENGDTILENTQLVDDLEGRVFEVELEKRKLTRVNLAKNSESEKSNSTPLDEGIVEKFTGWKGESEEISEQITRLSACYKTDFVALPQSTTPITCLKLLARLANSVGLIEWDNGIDDSLTCFVYFGSYICTCYTTLSEIVGEEFEFHNGINMISQHAMVTFDSEDPWRKEKKYFSIDPSFLVCNEEFDVAVLKLKENRQVPLGLYLSFHSPPLTGMIHIIGHPDGEVKCLDTGVVIPPSQREEEYLKCVQAVEAKGCQSDDIRISACFQNIANDPDMIIYHCSFSFDSCGSPVFDSSGALVAMHLGAIYRNGESTIGYGVSRDSFRFCDAPTNLEENGLWN